MDITPDQARAELARRELIRRGVSVEKAPTIVEQLPDSAKNALLNLTSGMISRVKDLGTNPETMANAMPATLGTAGGVALPWGGSTLGTATGQGIRDAALMALGKPIPSGTQHVGEIALSSFGDVAAMPMAKKFFLGRAIGALEKSKGVPAAQDIPSIPMPTGAKSIGDFINDAVDSVKSSGGKGSPTYWKQIKDQVDRIYSLGKDQALTTLDKGRLKWLNSQVQGGLNASVPGRKPLANALAQSQTIPNYLSKISKSIPWWGKAVGTAVIGDALARKLGSSNRK
jgi:hypothetical protein